ncbi:MAG: S41 family peptidase [Phycisphaeraceae bacterium]|nr:S41 family peptidase [Phycisphaeraceae bacterium]
MSISIRWRTCVTAGLLALTAGVWQASGMASTDDPQSPTTPVRLNGQQPLDLASFSRKLWDGAKFNRESALREVLWEAPEDAGLSRTISSLESALAQREQTRDDKVAEARRKLDEKLADPTDKKAVSEALRHANELFMLTTDKAGFLMEPRIAALIESAEQAAREAEAAEDWFIANELFFRLHLLLEEQGRFKPDVSRLSTRLTMMRLYVPEKFWELRNRERIAAGKPELPPYNGLGESFRDKLKGIDKMLVILATSAAERQQIERVPMRELIVSGIESLKVMLTTTELRAAFPTLADDARRDDLMAFLDERASRVRSARNEPNRQTLSDTLDDILDKNRQTVALPPEAVLHEFGNGAMGRLDDFSAIIWPDEVPRFDRMTSGVFVGVGIQIQLDDETQMIKVVTPLEGTPAQRAGIQKDDLIKKINGQSAVGISLNQAVDLITGPSNTRVTLSVERAGEEIEFTLNRARIEQVSVKGWRRVGTREDQWDWFIDPEQRIGYLRLTGFNEKTTAELRSAVSDMRRQGLRGLILDLRFNPGGLLTEAVSVSNLFVKSGTIVSTRGTTPGESRSASRDPDKITDIPIAVLINEGSASASEIVSGAIKHYADQGDIDAILIGQRTFGKGSVQNVWNLPPRSKMKLTTQYYMLPDGRIIHRRPGESDWGVTPHLLVDMLPQQTSDALKLRQEADVMPTDASGRVIESEVARTDPRRLLDEGMDPQLQWALVLLQSRAVATSPVPANHANRTTP